MYDPIYDQLSGDIANASAWKSRLRTRIRWWLKFRACLEVENIIQKKNKYYYIETRGTNAKS
jgi:hypothetical protein